MQKIGLEDHCRIIVLRFVLGEPIVGISGPQIWGGGVKTFSFRSLEFGGETHSPPKVSDFGGGKIVFPPQIWGSDPQIWMGKPILGVFTGPPNVWGGKRFPPKIPPQGGRNLGVPIPPPGSQILGGEKAFPPPNLGVKCQPCLNDHRDIV